MCGQGWVSGFLLDSQREMRGVVGGEGRPFFPPPRSFSRTSVGGDLNLTLAADLTAPSLFSETA